jgi:hypothetical protein
LFFAFAHRALVAVALAEELAARMLAVIDSPSAILIVTLFIIDSPLSMPDYV